MFVRLSKDVNMTNPIFPGNKQNHIVEVHNLINNGVETHQADLFMHNGTHIETESHYLNGRHISDYDISSFVFRRPQVSPLKDLKLKNKKDVLLLNTGGWFVDESIADIITKFDYKCVCIDSLSITDPENMECGINVHKILLGNDILIVEDTKTIPVLNYKRIYAIPLFIEDSEASPCTLIGEY